MTHLVRRSSFVLAVAALALGAWSLSSGGGSSAAAPARALAAAPASLEDFLSATYAPSWAAARARLLREGLLDEARLAAPFDAAALQPWSVTHERLGEALFGSGFDEPGLRRAVSGWYLPSVEENLARTGLDDGGRPFSAEERARVTAIVARHAELLDALAGAAAEELQALVRDLWQRDELLRVPSLETGEGEDAPLALAKAAGQPLTYRTLVALDGWTVLVAPDTTRSPALAEILAEIHARRAERFRELQEFLRARG